MLGLPHKGHLGVAVLADALGEAGTTGVALEHLRGHGPHVRGWYLISAPSSN
jgi:hypothetical protein